MIKLTWHGSLPENFQEVEEAVIKDLESIHDDLEGDPSALIFHTVLLGNSWEEGPVVHVWGEEGDRESYHCEHDMVPEWVSLKQWEDEEDPVDNDEGLSQYK